MKLIVMLSSIALTALAVTPGVTTGAAFRIEEATIADVHKALQNKQVTCRVIVQTYLDRIAAYDHKGPALDSILTLNSKALAQAEKLDADYARSGPVGPLHCIPLVLKDNYNTVDLPTTGGSASLAGAQPQSDAFVVVKLRKAGAVMPSRASPPLLCPPDSPDILPAPRWACPLEWIFWAAHGARDA
jgi:amidase